MATVILLTVLLVLIGGIGLSYLAASSILRFMGHRQQRHPAPLTAATADGSGV
jgi:hypothetical protein